MKSNQRLTIEFVYEQFRIAGCELLSTEYKNARTPLSYICNCGNVSTIRYDNFRQGKRCNGCRYIKIANKKRHSLAFIRKEFEDAGCELLSDNYKNGKQLLDYRCSCGNIAKIRYDNFRYGQRCWGCRVEKISGENSPHYKPHLTEEHRKIGRNDVYVREWRSKVFNRDKYTCNSCGKAGKGNLNAHHLYSYDVYENLRYEVSNGTTLCVECHVKFHKTYGFGNNTEFQFIEWLSTGGKPNG